MQTHKYSPRRVIKESISSSRKVGCNSNDACSGAQQNDTKNEGEGTPHFLEPNGIIKADPLLEQLSCETPILSLACITQGVSSSKVRKVILV